jgi:2'-5' RNA ligase
VPVPCADPLVAPWRSRGDPGIVTRRIPTHITVLFPFVPARALDETLRTRLRALLAPMEPIDYALTSVESWPGTVFLAPEPAAPLVELIERVRRAFPDRPLYGDPSLDPAPHVTIATESDPDRLERLTLDLRERLADRLPLACRADVVWLMEERPDGTWHRIDAFPLEGRPC